MHGINAVGAFGRITPQGTISIFAAGKYNVPMDMTIGPDQNLWFSEQDGTRVGRLTTGGTFLAVCQSDSVLRAGDRAAAQ